LKNRKLITGIIFVLVLILLVVFQFILSRQRRGGIGRPTTYNTGKQGYKAFYLLLKKIGYNTDRFERDFEELKDDPSSVLMIIQPYPSFTREEEIRNLIKWVRKGNRVILAADDYNGIYSALKIKLNYVNRADLTDPKGPLSENVKTIKDMDMARILPKKNDFEVLLKDEKGVICARVKQGKGEILIFTIPGIFNNSSIDSDENVILITNLLKYMGKTNVLIDESLHGYNFNKKSASFKIPRVVNLILIQLSIALFVFYLVMMKRFGKPRRLKEDTLRTSTEYIHSFAGLFMKAHTNDFALSNAVRSFKRKIARTYPISPDAPDEKFLESLEYIPEEDKGVIEAILEKCQKASRKKELSDAELVKLCNELDKIAGKLSK